MPGGIATAVDNSFSIEKKNNELDEFRSIVERPSIEKGSKVPAATKAIFAQSPILILTYAVVPRLGVAFPSFHALLYDAALTGLQS
jgi:hypothetical protein